MSTVVEQGKCPGDAVGESGHVASREFPFDLLYSWRCPRSEATRWRYEDENMVSSVKHVVRNIGTIFKLVSLPFLLVVCTGEVLSRSSSFSKSNELHFARLDESPVSSVEKSTINDEKEFSQQKFA